jgi:putative sigma-54 modulation protein
MHIHLSPRHMPLTAAIHQAVATQLGNLEDLGTEIIAAHVVLLHDDVGDPVHRYQVRVHLAIPGPDIFATDSQNDLYIAMERVVAKLARQLRKRKTARKDKGRTVTQRAMELQKQTGSLPRAIRQSLAVNGGRASSSGRKRSGRAH